MPFENIDKNKKKAIESVISQIEKAYGKGSIMALGEKAHTQTEVIPTGIPSVDAILGIGGMPRGRIIEIYGNESSGKTTLALHVVAQAQKQGGVAAFIDAEHAFDPNYAKALGIDIDSLLVSQPDYGEQALEIAETLVRSGAIDVIIIDSVAALVPRAELEGDMGDANIALQARLMSQALRKLTSSVNKSKTCMIFINQLRSKVGVMFGNPEVTTGGNALKFYASIRIELKKKSQTLKKNDAVLGDTVTIKVVKNKLAAPFRQTSVDVIYGEGFSVYSDVLNIAVEAGIVDKSGSWYSYKNEKLGQGKDNAIEFMKNHPDIFEEIYRSVRIYLGLEEEEQNDSNKVEKEQ